MPNLDSLNKWGTGFMAIAHSKDYIFVRDSSAIANENSYYKEDY
jgi:hypothetical protein